MKRQRPPMPPLAVRVEVAERQYFQLAGNNGAGAVLAVKLQLAENAHFSLAFRLEWLLDRLFWQTKFALDHDPALILRPYNPRIKDVAARYTPHAHDPDSLIYRSKADHQRKTTGRPLGAERTITTKGSDIGLKTKFGKLEKKLAKPRQIQKIAQRRDPWPKARKLNSKNGK